MEYNTLSTQEQLTAARDRLHATELDHYRLSITPSDPSSTDQRLDELEQVAEEAREEVARLTAAAQEDEAPPEG